MSYRSVRIYLLLLLLLSLLLLMLLLLVVVVLELVLLSLPLLLGVDGIIAVPCGLDSQTDAAYVNN